MPAVLRSRSSLDIVLLCYRKGSECATYQRPQLVAFSVGRLHSARSSEITDPVRARPLLPASCPPARLSRPLVAILLFLSRIGHLICSDAFRCARSECSSLPPSFCLRTSEAEREYVLQQGAREGTFSLLACILLGISDDCWRIKVIISSNCVGCRFILPLLCAICLPKGYIAFTTLDSRDQTTTDARSYCIRAR